MSVLMRMAEGDFEQLLYCHGEVSGVRAIIGIHDTTLGPAIGGLRVHPYANEAEALEDVLRISESMTLKASAAGLNHGGGCAVLICDPREGKNEGLLRAFGRHVESLCGRFIVGQDAGTTVEDMETISQETRFVSGLRKSRGGSGDPAEKAASGVLRGIQACLEFTCGDGALPDRTIAIQGLGAVGLELARLAVEEGARVIATDKDPRRIEKAQTFLTLEVVSPEKLLETPCDVLAPCALGGIITAELVPRLKTRIIAGAANNQLETQHVGDLLHEAGIVYAPDFVINAGGLINVAEELRGYDETTANLKIGKLGRSIETILHRSKERNIPTQQAAREMAMERIQRIREVRRTFLPSEH
jgi:leucine dehydrogenase